MLNQLIFLIMGHFFGVIVKCNKLKLELNKKINSRGFPNMKLALTAIQLVVTLLLLHIKIKYVPEKYQLIA